MTRQRQALLVASVGLLFTAVLAVRVIIGADGDPTVFVAFGEKATEVRAYAEARLGSVVLRPEQGHDGKFFFVQANDPWLLEPTENASVLDRPLYRSQRMLFPLLAGGFGVFPPRVIVWAMVVLNLLALGVGTWVVALLASEMGGSPWLGLAFALNLGFISEMNIGGAGIVAAAAAFGAVLAFLRGRDGWGVVMLVLAVLSREAMLIAAVGSAWWLWRENRRRTSLFALAFPLSAVGLWALYLRFRVGWDQAAPQVQEIGIPFQGFISAASSWLGDPVDFITGITMLFLLLLYVRRVVLAGHLVGWAFLGFVLLAVVFTEQVWRSYFDITRAVAPVITSFVLLMFVDPYRRTEGKGSSRPQAWIRSGAKSGGQ